VYRRSSAVILQVIEIDRERAVHASSAQPSGTQQHRVTRTRWPNAGMHRSAHVNIRINSRLSDRPTVYCLLSDGRTVEGRQSVGWTCVASMSCEGGGVEGGGAAMRTRRMACASS